MARLTNDDIVAIIESKDFEVVDISQYKNLKSTITIACKHGHEIETTLTEVRKKNFRCPECVYVKANVQKEVPEKKGYRVIGFDNATEKFGVAIFDDRELVYSNVLKFNGTADTRLKQIYDVIEQIVVQKWKPDLVIFEDIQLKQKKRKFSNVKTFKTLAMLQGIIKVILMNNNVPYKVVMASTWRSGVGVPISPREVAKQKAIDMVKKLYGLELTDDEAEAILIAKYGSDMYTEIEFYTF